MRQLRWGSRRDNAKDSGLGRADASFPLAQVMLAQLELLEELTQLMDEPDSRGVNPKSSRAGLSGLGQCAEL